MQFHTSKFEFLQLRTQHNTSDAGYRHSSYNREAKNGTNYHVYQLYAAQSKRAETFHYGPFLRIKQ